MNVLRNVHQALTVRGLLLDIHPTADDGAVRAGGRGLGFVEAEPFEPVVAYVDEAVDELVADGLLDDVRRVEREIDEVYADAGELFEMADGWEHHALDAATRRRIRAAEPPFHVLWRVAFRLLRKRAARRRRRL